MNALDLAWWTGFAKEAQAVGLTEAQTKQLAAIFKRAQYSGGSLNAPSFTPPPAVPKPAAPAQSSPLIKDVLAQGGSKPEFTAGRPAPQRMLPPQQAVVAQRTSAEPIPPQQQYVPAVGGRSMPTRAQWGAHGVAGRQLHAPAWGAQAATVAQHAPPQPNWAPARRPPPPAVGGSPRNQPAPAPDAKQLFALQQELADLQQQYARANPYGGMGGMGGYGMGGYRPYPSMFGPFAYGFGGMAGRAGYPSWTMPYYGM